jgi:hypothetical protein
MLIFDASKNKKIQMAIESSGIENDKLKFTFVIDTGKVQYGFPCRFNEGRVEIDVPPLEEVIKNLTPGTYGARLDVTGDDKYYLKPFNESIEIKQAPRIKTASIDESDVSEDIKVAVSGLFESDGGEEEKPVVEDKEEKGEEDKKSGISRFFEGK